MDGRGIPSSPVGRTPPLMLRCIFAGAGHCRRISLQGTTHPPGLHMPMVRGTQTISTIGKGHDSRTLQPTIFQVHASAI